MRLLIGAIAVTTLPFTAIAAPDTGSIRGTADPSWQIIVTNLDDGSVSGIMSKCDGTYEATGLRPGRYRIKENGPRHAPRTLSVSANHISETDLAPQRVSDQN